MLSAYISRRDKSLPLQLHLQPLFSSSESPQRSEAGVSKMSSILLSSSSPQPTVGEAVSHFLEEVEERLHLAVEEADLPEAAAVLE